MYCLLRMVVTFCILFTLVPGLSKAEPMPSKETVRSVQSKLNNYGYSHGIVDGKMSQETVNALRLFQEDYELPVSGQIDKETLVALGVNGKFEEVVAATVPAQGTPVTQEESRNTKQSPSALTQSGHFVQGIGGTLNEMGDDNSGSWIGSGFSMAGKIYTSMGENISAFGENEKGVGEASNDLFQDASTAVLEPDK